MSFWRHITRCLIQEFSTHSTVRINISTQYISYLYMLWNTVSPQKKLPPFCFFRITVKREPISIILGHVNEMWRNRVINPNPNPDPNLTLILTLTLTLTLILTLTLTLFSSYSYFIHSCQWCSQGQNLGHIKNIHLHSCKHKTVKLKLALTLTLTLTDTGGAVLTLMLGYRRLRIYKLKWKI